jgi:hypothetical protein
VQLTAAWCSQQQSIHLLTCTRIHNRAMVLLYTAKVHTNYICAQLSVMLMHSTACWGSDKSRAPLLPSKRWVAGWWRGQGWGGVEGGMLPVAHPCRSYTRTAHLPFNTRDVVVGQCKAVARWFCGWLCMAGLKAFYLIPTPCTTDSAVKQITGGATPHMATPVVCNVAVNQLRLTRMHGCTRRQACEALRATMR